MATSLSILMPVYNELATVERAIDDALTADLPVESRQLVIVDDGSTDGTRELLQEHEWPDTVTLVREAWTVPSEYAFGDGKIVPLRAGEILRWQVR